MPLCPERFSLWTTKETSSSPVVQRSPSITHAEKRLRGREIAKLKKESETGKEKATKSAKEVTQLLEITVSTH